MITILLFVSLAVSIVFTSIAIRELGELPGSVSSAVFRMPYGQRYAWTLMLWLSTYTLTPAMFGVMPVDFHPAAHAFATSVLLAGVMPLFKRTISRGFRVLVTSAWFFSQVCAALICPLLLLAWLVVVTFLFTVFIIKGDVPYALHGKGVFIAESLCYVTLFTSVLLKLL